MNPGGANQRRCKRSPRREAATKVGVQPSGCGGTLKRELQRRRQSVRGGYVLVLVVAMLFGLFALAALVIDFGFVRLTQRQMLSATDAAAMEGLRWRDVQRWEQLPGYLNPSGLTGQIPAEQQSEIGRMAAVSMVSLMMARKASDTTDPANYGFGPELQATATASGGPAAGPLLTPAQPPVYQPQLQTNSGNATGGDIVEGYYGSDQPAVEQSDYTRNDYSPAVSSTSGTNPPPSMLVRMRRVAPGNPLDLEPGDSSSGPAVPFLFAYGAPIDRASIAQGVTVRGTSIASVGFNPANNPQISSSDPYNAGNYYQTIGMVSSVGWESSLSVGAVPLAVSADQWSPQSAVTLTIDSNGKIVQASAGFLVDTSAVDATQGKITSLGPIVLGQTATSTATAPPLAGQASVYVLLVSAANQVIGIGAADVTYGNQSITLQPVANRVAWENASATLVQPLATGVNVPALWTLRAAVQYPLYSPVLVNR